MQDCWQENPDDRPTFEILREELKEMENQHQVNYKHQKQVITLRELKKNSMFSRKGLTVDIVNNELRLILYIVRRVKFLAVLLNKTDPRSNEISGSSISLFNRRNIYSMPGDTIQITLL